MTEFFDYIVIGGRSTGCVVAGRLAEIGNKSICLVEASPNDRNPFIHMPAGFESPWARH